MTVFVTRQRIARLRCGCPHLLSCSACIKETNLTTSYKMETTSCHKNIHTSYGMSRHAFCTATRWRAQRANVVTQLDPGGSRTGSNLHCSQTCHSVIPHRVELKCTEESTHHHFLRWQGQVSDCIPQKHTLLRKVPLHCLRRVADCARRLQHDKPILLSQDTS